MVLTFPHELTFSSLIQQIYGQQDHRRQNIFQHSKTFHCKFKMNGIDAFAKKNLAIFWISMLGPVFLIFITDNLSVFKTDNLSVLKTDRLSSDNLSVWPSASGQRPAMGGQRHNAYPGTCIRKRPGFMGRGV